MNRPGLRWRFIRATDGVRRRVFQSQKLDIAALCGMGLIVSGVVVINLFSGVSSQ